MVLHADSSQYGSHRAGSSTLLPDDLAYIAGGDAQAQHRALFSFNSFNDYSSRLVNESPGDFRHELLHIVRPFLVRHSFASLEDVGVSL
jgi:hypothetical protein